jgi:hypothetical protein
MAVMQFAPAEQWAYHGPDAVLQGELCADGKRIALLASGNDWGLAQIAIRLKSLTCDVKPADVEGVPKGNAFYVPATWPVAVQLGWSITSGQSITLQWAPGPRLTAWMTAELTWRTSPLPDPLAGYPPWLTPYPHQVSGAAAIDRAGKFLLYDEPGVGKTITCITGVDSRRLRDIEVFPALIVVPSWEIGDHWTREIVKWAPAWGEPVLYGGPDREAKLPGAQAVITTYATLTRDAPDMRSRLARHGWQTVIADEAHLAKTARSKRSHALRRVAAKAPTFIAATGTPVTRNVKDAYPLWDAMDHASFPSEERAGARYYQKVPGGDYEEKILGLNPLSEAEYFEVMLGSARRVAKADVLRDLPPKVYSLRRPVIPPEWKRAYETLRDDMIARLPDEGELPVMTVLVQMKRLSQLASSAADVTVTMEPDELTGLPVPKYDVKLKAPSWKAESLLGIIGERAGTPVVAFAESRQLAMITGEYCRQAGLRHGYVVGIGGGITRVTRAQAVEDFQAGKLDVIICTTGAGGLGITLTASDCCVMLQRPFALDLAIQPEDRCLTAGTPVLTPDGWRPAGDIIAGDLVITHTGAAQPVTDTWSRLAPATRIMAEISITGQAPVTCTADHPFLLKSGQWRDAGDLKPGNWLAMPGNDVTAELTSLPFEGARITDSFASGGVGQGSTQRNGRLRHAPADIDVTDDFLYVLGYFAGDGFASTASGKGRFISFAGNTGTKTAALDRCERWAATQDLHGNRRQPLPGSHGTEQRFYSAEWAYWFRAAFGHGARNKRLPALALQLNARQSRVILDGLGASDGYRREGRPRCEYSTMSPQLAANVLQLATRVGYRPSLTRGSTGQYLVAYGGEPGPHTAGRVRSVLLRYPGKAGTARQERICDLTVKEAETFVAGGIVVHNCHRPGAEKHDQIDIIDIVAQDTMDERVRAILREKGGQLAQLVQDPRVVRELLGGLK